MWRLLMMAVLASCGHTLMRDTVVTKVSATEAQVCLKPGTFAVGDHVHVFQTVCHVRGIRAVDCRHDVVGEGRITRVINEHHAAVEVLASSRLEEGYGIEIVR